MAKATVKIETIEVPVTTYEVVPTTVISLTLTLEEAEALHRITSNIGGSPAKTRGKIDNIARALYGAGVDKADVPTKGSIYFED